MTTRLIPIVLAVCVGASLAGFAAPPAKKKPDPKDPAVAPPPAPAAPVKPPVVEPVKPPAATPPKPVGPTVRFCGVERAHKAHQFRGRGGVLYRCPGKVASPGPKGPPRP